MENNIEKEEKLIEAIKKNGVSKNNIPNAGDVTSEYIEDLIMVENVLRLNKWQRETEKILKKNATKFKINWKIFIAAASMAFFLSFSYFSLNKNFISDLIVENESSLRGEKTEISSENPQEKAYQYFVKGKANYYAKDYKGAISAYKNAIEIPNLRIQFHEAIMWHLCVAYLQNNETMQCEHILNKIEKIKNPKYEINKLDLLKLKTQLWLKKNF